MPGSLITRISTDLSLTEQSYHLMVEACAGHEDPVFCQDNLRTSWPAMATCLYSDWVLPGISCSHYGGCQRSSQSGTCHTTGNLMGEAQHKKKRTSFKIAFFLDQSFTFAVLGTTVQLNHELFKVEENSSKACP